jgi:hypothetical protein
VSSIQLWLFDFDADLDPAFKSDADSDPASQKRCGYECGSATLVIGTTIFSTKKITTWFSGILVELEIADP